MLRDPPRPTPFPYTPLFRSSDPIAVLSTIKIEGTDVGAENLSSDDEGGDLNPRFELRRPYFATYVLTVGSADDDEACYAYRMRSEEHTSELQSRLHLVCRLL